ncbi:MAG: DMT family transporter [Burkholderiaceae bacterium]|nr:DMT family transporter [Burkholderiaceae bacterium]
MRGCGRCLGRCGQDGLQLPPSRHLSAAPPTEGTAAPLGASERSGPGRFTSGSRQPRAYAARRCRLRSRSSGRLAGGPPRRLAGMPAWGTLAAAALLGSLSSGISLMLFVVALRHLGTARAGACFPMVPSFGALLAVTVLGETVSPSLLLAGAAMGLGVWLHRGERHLHRQAHEALEHEHEHEHDLHHDHHLPGEVDPARHTQRHRHLPLVHSHARFPDQHRRHSH